MGGKRAQFGLAFEDCSRSYSRKNGGKVGLLSIHCSRLASAVQAPSPWLHLVVAIDEQ